MLKFRCSFCFTPALSIFLLLAFSVCAWSQQSPSTADAQAGGKELEKQGGMQGISTVAIVPFRSIATESDAPRGSIRCPVSGALFRTCPSTVPDSEKVLMDLFSKKASTYKGFRWIGAGEESSLSAESFKLWRIEALQKKGRDLKADAVIAGHVFCFRERVGYPLSVEKPASVAYGIYMVRTSDGAVLWKGIFDRTQQSLFENILQASAFFKGGGKWLTAEELAGFGIDEILKSFPVAGPEKTAEQK